ncbi:MAG: Uma2 family endonuclease [Acidobacteria bacterium]|nr:Uma2 family endonuclease [Acidobacteriota bacterium]MYJ06228.1 Uma2 family endonuclease [Acidobacteriota bacterium]
MNRHKVHVSNVPIGNYRLSRVEYDRAVEAGVFAADAKLELIDGDLRAMTPEGSRHALGIDLVADYLRRVFSPGCYVRIQHPLATDDYSEPEPDVAVVTGVMRDYRDAHPTSAVLVVEVAIESLQHDRSVKQSVYARCGIPEYWILAIPEARLEVYRDPDADGYRSVTKHAAGDSVAPAARPQARIVVNDLLP